MEACNKKGHKSKLRNTVIITDNTNLNNSHLDGSVVKHQTPEHEAPGSNPH